MVQLQLNEEDRQRFCSVAPRLTLSPTVAEAKGCDQDTLNWTGSSVHPCPHVWLAFPPQVALQYSCGSFGQSGVSVFEHHVSCVLSTPATLNPAE